jgi:hypothetical protein
MRMTSMGITGTSMSIHMITTATRIRMIMAIHTIIRMHTSLMGPPSGHDRNRHLMCEYGISLTT